MSYQVFQYFDANAALRPGLVVEGQHYDLEGPSLEDMLGAWEQAQVRLRDLARRIAKGERALRSLPAETLRFAPPVPLTATVYGAGANYRDHVEAVARTLNMKLMADPRSEGVPPWHFMKPGRATLAAHGESVAYPAHSRKLDWEAELAVIIGRAATHVTVDSALDYVAGYSCANDLSARDTFIRAKVDASSPFRFDWIGQKCFRGSCPLGPVLTPAEFIESPEHLSIKLWVDDELKQNSSTSNHIYGVAEQIAHLSTRVDLFPGDVILTGTPAGTGIESGKFLTGGENIRVEIEGLGALETKITK